MRLWCLAKKHKVKEVLGFDIKRDYLYLKAEGMESYGHLDFAPDYKIEQKVYTVGNVHGEGIAIRDGIISSETTDLNDPDVKFLRYSAGTSPGNSGGPLVDEQGRVVALVFAATWTENFNLGTSAEDLKKGFDKFVGAKTAEQSVPITLNKLLNFNAQTMLQAMSLPYLSQFDDYPEIVEEFNDISIDITVPTNFSTIDQLVLTGLNQKLTEAYNSVQDIMLKKDEIVLDWKSFVTEKTPAILPSQFDFSQNIFLKKNGRYFPKVAGFIDSPSKADMTKYTNQLEKERKFDFQAYGYNIHYEDKKVGMTEADAFYKPRNTTGAKLRLQDLSKGVPYSQLVVWNGEKQNFDLEKFMSNFAEPDGVLVGAASRFIRP
ncbi:MAG: serine protease, partial [Bdellovibrionales bacterium]|nr:serine protease [Bdellovibrionales bacterium]